MEEEKDYTLFYRLPYRASSVNSESCSRYSIYRSDTNKLVRYADTMKEAERVCDKHNKKRK